MLWSAALLFLLAALLAGCSNSASTETSAPANSGQTESSGVGGMQGSSAPDASGARLFNTLRRVEELANDKDYPLSAEQAKEILPIVKDIAAQKDITAAYAAEKQKEITAVLSPEQQKVISTPPQRKVDNGERNAGNRPGSPANAGRNGNNQGSFQNGFLEHLISALQQKAGS